MLYVVGYTDLNVLLSSFHSCLFCCLGKRKWDQQDHLIVLREMQASDEKQLELRQRQIIMEDAQEARHQDLSREYIGSKQGPSVKPFWVPGASLYKL